MRCFEKGTFLPKRGINFFVLNMYTCAPLCYYKGVERTQHIKGRRWKMYKWLDKMIEGNIYEVIECDGVTTTGIFKGIVTDHSDFMGFVFIQEEGKTGATMLCPDDVVKVKEIKND
jgi:hypothetical protein